MGTDPEPEWMRPATWTAAGLPFDLRALRFVLASAEYLSFTSAAHALNARVSSVSRRVRDFEDQIGVALFERTSAGVRLTNAGAHFIDEVIPALRQVEGALHHAGAAGRVEHGTIRIGISTTLAGGLLRNLLASFRLSFGGVQLEVRDGGRREHLRAIRARKLDIAFLIGEATASDFDSLELWRERVHVAMSVTHPLAAKVTISWSDLHDSRFLVTMHNTGPEVHEYIVRRIGKVSTTAEVTYCAVSQANLLNLVTLGDEITVVSEGWTKTHFPGLILRPLDNEDDELSIHAVWSPDNDNPALRRFISFVRAELPKVAD